jgi:hypothetical protein
LCRRSARHFGAASSCSTSARAPNLLHHWSHGGTRWTAPAQDFRCDDLLVVQLSRPAAVKRTSEVDLTQTVVTGLKAQCDSRSDPNKPEEALMALVKKRLALMNELPAETPMNNMNFKNMTGNDAMSVRGLFGNQQEYTKTFSIIASCNDPMKLWENQINRNPKQSGVNSVRCHTRM